MPDNDQLSYHQVLVGRFPTGMRGLDECFEALYRQGRAPDTKVATELVARASRHNYIASSAHHEFAAALLREYRKYCEQRASGQSTTSARETWRAIPREQVPWFPMLDQALCDGCDKCLEFCSKAVYAKQDDGPVTVVNPLNCVVGCDACARLCRRGAITFPPRAMLRTFAH